MALPVSSPSYSSRRGPSIRQNSCAFLSNPSGRSEPAAPPTAVRQVAFLAPDEGPTAGAPPATAVAAPVVAAVQPAAPEPAPPRVAEPSGDIKMSAAAAPALTETLNSAVQRLAEEKAENQRLRDTVAAQERALAEKDSMIQQLKADLATYDTRIKGLEESLEKWKADILGFRDEMRSCEEAQIQVQQEILMLLKGFKKEGQAK